MLLAALAPLAFPRPLRGQTPEAQLYKTARAAVRVGLIEPFCGQFYLIDRKQLEAVRSSVMRDGIERFGSSALNRAMQAVQPEFQTEMQAGAATWCPKQRAAYRKIGLPSLIGSNLP